MTFRISRWCLSSQARRKRRTFASFMGVWTPQNCFVHRNRTLSNVMFGVIRLILKLVNFYRHKTKFSHRLTYTLACKRCCSPFNQHHHWSATASMSVCALHTKFSRRDFSEDRWQTFAHVVLFTFSGVPLSLAARTIRARAALANGIASQKGFC